MVTIFSGIEKKAEYLSKLPIGVGGHTKFLAREALKLGCKLEKVADNGEEIYNSLGSHQDGTATAFYMISCGGKQVEFEVYYKIRSD